MTKPIVAVAALLLVEECRLRLDDPVDDLLPELADRRVLIDPRAARSSTRSAGNRPITCATCSPSARARHGLRAPVAAAAAGGDGRASTRRRPPAATTPPTPRRVDAPCVVAAAVPARRTVALQHGLGRARRADRPSRRVSRSTFSCAERVFEPLGMVDTGFSTGATLDRLGSCYIDDTGDRRTVVHDPPDGQWVSPPAFPSGRRRARVDGRRLRTPSAACCCPTAGCPTGRLLSPASVEAMTTDQPRRRRVARRVPTRRLAGLGVRRRRAGPPHRGGSDGGSYGWDGGLGSSWGNDPTERLVGVLLTTDSSAALSPPTRSRTSGPAAGGDGVIETKTKRRWVGEGGERGGGGRWGRKRGHRPPPPPPNSTPHRPPPPPPREGGAESVHGGGGELVFDGGCPPTNRTSRR